MSPLLPKLNKETNNMTPDKDSTDHLLTNGTSSSYCKKEKIGQFSLPCEEGPSIVAYLLTLGSVLLVIASMPLSLIFVVKVVQEYERAVIFRLGRLLTGGARGPGVFFIIPCVDIYEKVDMRTQTFEIPPQEILTKDSVTVFVNAIMYYKVANATHAVSNVDDYSGSARLLAATTLRNVLGTLTLGEILSQRESIAKDMRQNLDVATEPWGVKVERVEVKDVRVPEQLQRAMAAEAEAAREARAKVIAAEGEHKASRALRQAAEVIVDSPAALQLRYLQTLNSISAENNSTIVFPVPIDIMSSFMSTSVNDATDGSLLEPVHTYVKTPGYQHSPSSYISGSSGSSGARERKVSIKDERSSQDTTNKQRERPRRVMRGLTVDSSHLDDIDGLDFKIPEVDLDVPDIDIGETVDMT